MYPINYFEKRGKKITSEMILQCYSDYNEKIILKSNKCGCYCCVKMFKPKDIVDWKIEKWGKTAKCPYCKNTTVLPEATTYRLTMNLLKKMNYFWFVEDD